MNASRCREQEPMVHGPEASLNEFSVKLSLNRVVDSVEIATGTLTIGGLKCYRVQTMPQQFSDSSGIQSAIRDRPHGIKCSVRVSEKEVGHGE